MFQNSQRLFSLSFLSLILILADTAHSQTLADPLEEDPPLIHIQGDPEVISEKIRKHGAGLIRASLYSAGWNYVIQQIETGDKKWLEVGVGLRSGSDLGATHSLHMALLEEDPPLIHIQGDPEVISEQIRKHGAFLIRGSLEYAGWMYVIQHIETGDKKWLEVGVGLLSGSDAGATHSLQMALSEALVISPSEVLQLAPEYTIESVCSEDVDNYNTYEEAVAKNKKAIKAVSSIDDPRLNKRKKTCLKELNESPKHLKSFYGE